MPDDKILMALLDELGRKLSTQAEKHREQDEYYSGERPMPEAVRQANVTRAYDLLMPAAEAPWGSVIVDSVIDRLEVTGIDTGAEEADKALWNIWRANGMDAESNLAHNAALVGGRAFAIVWPTRDGTSAKITLESPEQVVVKYREGSRTERVAALRQWTEDEVMRASLFLPDGVYSFKAEGRDTLAPKWEPDDEANDGRRFLPNPFPGGAIPVVELAVNRRLKPGPWPFARGEYEHCTGLIDRINLLTFLGLVVAFWMGFPLRGVIGEKIIRETLTDDDGNPLFEADGETPQTRAEPPFDVHADSMFQLENPDAKLAEFQAADRKNLSVYPELEQLATVTKTPRHYFPMEGGGSNISTDTIIAYEGGLHAKCSTHKASLGQGWEEVNRLCGMLRKIEVPATSRILWADHETRSLAERADAAAKLKELLPWQALAEKVLNASPEEIAKWEAQAGSSAFSELLSAVQEPSTVGEPAD